MRSNTRKSLSMFELNQGVLRTPPVLPGSSMKLLPHLSLDRRADRRGQVLDVGHHFLAQDPVLLDLFRAQHAGEDGQELAEDPDDDRDQIRA